MSDSSQPAPISKQRLEAARRIGYSPRSGELTTGVVLLAAALIAQICLPALLQAFRELVESGFQPHSFHGSSLSPGFQPAAIKIGREVLRIASACWSAAFVIDLTQVGFVWSPVTSLPHLERVSPWSGLSRMVSWPTFERACLLTVKVVVALIGLGLVTDFALRAAFAESGITAGDALVGWNTGIHWTSLMLAATGGCCLMTGLVDAWVRRRRWQLSIEKTEDERRRGD